MEARKNGPALGDVNGTPLVAMAGMLHSFSGWKLAEIAAHFRVSVTTTCRAVADHERRMRNDPAYQAAVAQFVATTISAIYGGIAEPSMQPMRG
jgi:hypothetical protein